MRKLGIAVARMASIGVLALACDAPPMGLDLADRSLATEVSTKKLDPGVCSTANPGFQTTSTHPYFPFVVGDQWYYEGEDESLLISVLDQTRVIEGVETRVIEEREWEDDELLEVSWNYFAQAADGTVCYFGEDVDIFEDEQISHEGAWCADEAGSMPGIFMPADPQPGMKYQTEFGAGAQDQVKIVGSGPVTVPYGPFPETIRWREFNPLDGDKGYKVFAEGFGLVIDESLLLIDFEEDASAPGSPIPTDQSCGDLND
jgi:hypothetical protein